MTQRKAKKNLRGKHSALKRERFGISRVELVVAFAMVLILTLFFPFSGDDWAWGSSLGMKRLFALFENYNGRYVSNLLVLVFSRNIVFRGIFEAFVWVGIAICASSIIGKSKRCFFWATLVVIAGVPVAIRAQSLVWVSGFVNYVFPLFLLLIYIALLRPAFEERYSGMNVPALLLAALAACSTMCIETVAVYNLIVPLVVLAFIKLKHGFWDHGHVAYWVGGAFAAVVVFSNGAYWNVAAGSDDYRSAGLADISDKILWLSKEMVVEYAPILILVILIAMLAIRLCSCAGNCGKIALLVLLAACLALVFFASLGFLNGKALCVAAFIVYAMLLVVCVAVFAWFRDIAPLFVFLSVLALVLPLIVVNPVGPRNMFAPWLLLGLLAFVLAALVVADDILRVVGVLAFACFLLFVGYLCSIYLPIQLSSYERLDSVRSAVARGDASIAVDRLPSSACVWMGDPSNKLWSTRYKMYYDIPEYFEITVK